MSHIYIAPLQDKSLFKIGKAENPSKRLTSLSYFYDIELDKVVILKCQTTEASFKIETVLHEVFKDKNIQLEHDGGTEFFSFSDFESAAELLYSFAKANPRAYSIVKFVKDATIHPPAKAEVIAKRFADKIRYRRRLAGVTQEKLATTAGISKRTLERLESEGIANFSNIIRVVSALGIEKELLGI